MKYGILPQLYTDALPMLCDSRGCLKDRWRNHRFCEKHLRHVRKREEKRLEKLQDNGRTIIYFVQQGDDGPIKIGKTCNIDARMSGLQTANPNKLNLLLAFNSTEDHEKLLHKQFSSYRMSGEWFEPSKEILKYIKSRASRS